MDLAYVCEWERWPKITHCPSVPLACAWSCRNLIAFTTDLRNDDQDLTRIIHILDTEHPWDVHSINSEHSEAITCLEWDQSGEGPPGLFLYGEGYMMLTFDPESQGSSAVFLVTSPESRAGT